MSLSPAIADKLHAFARRRRTLIATRGLCVGIVALLGVMSVIVLIDWLVVIRENWIRWAMSLGGYVIVAVVVWWTCVRLLMKIPGPAELARRMEQAEPTLREDLLSAVELGMAKDDARFDSPVFRSLLQQSVTQRVERLHTSSLLPPRLIGRWVQIASLVLIVCVGLMFVPDLRFINRLTRAMMPAAPVDRVASVRVKIIAPNPAEPRVPHNDAVSVIVELSGTGGADAERVILETHRSGEEAATEEITMKPVGATRQYSAAIQLGRDPVSYRILAGDAVTRLYTIQTGARPHVTLFSKTYNYPDYAKRKSETVEEKTGDLEALQGTTVELSMRSDQPVQAAELRVEYADKTTETLPLDVLSPTEVRGKLPLKQGGTYRVHLVAADTAFDNQFDPPYVISLTPDAPPLIELTQPAQNVELPADAALPVAINASDDIGLKSIVQSITINGGQPVERIIATQPGDDWQSTQPVDLYELTLAPGDQVALRYAAIDLAGQRSETPARQVTILSSGFDPARLAGVNAKRRLADAIAAWQASIADIHSAHSDSLARLTDMTPDRRADLLRQIDGDLAQVDAKANEAYRLTLAAIDANPADSDAADLAAVGRQIRYIQDMLDLTMGKAHDPDQTVPGGAERFAEVASVVKRAFDSMVLADDSDALLRDMATLAADLRELAGGDARDDAARQRLVRRAQLVVTQIERVESHAKDMAQRDRVLAGTIDQIITLKLTPAKAALKAAADAPEPGAEVGQAINALAGAMQQTRKQVGTIAASLDRKRSEGRVALESLAADSMQSQRLGELLRSMAEMNDRRRDTDAVWSSDLGLGIRAVGAITASAEHDAIESAARLQRVRDALHVLETGHRVVSMHRLTVDLASREKWRRSEGDALTKHPRDWRWISGRVSPVADALTVRRMNTEAIHRMRDLPSGDAFKQADSELPHWLSSLKVASVHSELEAVGRELDQIRRLIADDMARARAILAAEAPSLPQAMKALAAESRALKDQAEQLADALPQKDAAEAAKDVATLQEKQQSLDEKLGELTDALAREANAQDLFTDEGRQHARDADDARAMIQKPAQEAKQELANAAQAPQAEQKAQHVDQAGAKDEKLAEALDQLAQHWENLEAGKQEETRAALREAEKDLGIKRELDAQYGRMEKLADLAEKSPQEQMKALEQELAQNPAMKQELSEISKDAVRDAKQSLDDASTQQGELARDLAQAAKEAERPRDHLDPQMKQLGDKAAQLAQKAAAIEQSSRSSSQDASQSAGDAKQALQQAAQAANQAAQTPQDQAAAKAAQAKAMQQAMEKAASELKESSDQANAASDAIREAERKATSLLAIGDPTPEERQKASELLLNSQRFQKEAKDAAREAGLAADEAKRMAEAAKAIAEDLAQATTAGDETMKQAGAQQGPIAQQAQAAAEDVGRAQRHEARMNNQPAAGELGKTEQAIGQTADQQIKPLGQQLAQAMKPSDASEAVGKSQEALAQQAAKLGQMMQSSPSGNAQGKQSEGQAQGNGQQPQPSANASTPKLTAAQGAPAGAKGSPAEQEAAQWMARALDELDRAMNGQQSGESSSPSSQAGQNSGQNGQPSSGNGSPSAGEQAAEAMRQAASAQAQAMAEARQQGGPQAPGQGALPGDAMAQAGQSSQGQGQGQGQGQEQSPSQGQGQSGQNSSAMAGGSPQNGQPGQGSSPGNGGGNGLQGGTLGDANRLKNGEWGKLPPRLTQELIEGQRDEVTGEYRGAVEAYFRAIAKQAREKGGN